MQTLKITLEAARVNARLTQREAADALGVSVQTINAWENEPSKIKMGDAINISKLYGMGLENIIFMPE